MDNAPPTTHRVAEFFKWDAEKCLEVQPTFQRKPVWPYRNKSWLMDTIINKLPIPEIYVQIQTDREGNTKYIVVDGQQRIRAVLDFLHGEYPISEEDSKEYGGRYFEQLPDGVRQDIWDYALVTRELKTSRESDVREIFQRLNKNVIPLNRQELRHATYGGKMIRLIYELADDDYWDEQRIVKPSDIRRMLDAEFVGELVMGIMTGITKRDEDLMDKFYKDYDDDFPKESEVKQAFGRTKHKIDEIMGQELRATRWNQKSEFYSLFMAVYELMKDYHFPPEKYNGMKDRLCEFSGEIDRLVNSTDATAPHASSVQVAEFLNTVVSSTTLEEPRKTRDRVTRSLLIPHLVPKDPKRSFTEEEKRIIWDLSPSKTCAFCGQKVETFEDYEPNHKVRHTDGGKTEISNGEVAHRRCNRSDKPQP
jgi:hypothetical protein